MRFLFSEQIKNKKKSRPPVSGPWETHWAVKEFGEMLRGQSIEGCEEKDLVHNV